MILVGLATGLRYPDLLHFTMHQLREELLKGRTCIIGNTGESKTTGAGFDSADDHVRVFPIPDLILLGGRINFIASSKSISQSFVL